MSERLDNSRASSSIAAVPSLADPFARSVKDVSALSRLLYPLKELKAFIACECLSRWSHSTLKRLPRLRVSTPLVSLDP